jgi:hypothetical protein
MREKMCKTNRKQEVKNLWQDEFGEGDLVMCEDYFKNQYYMTQVIN